MAHYFLILNCGSSSIKFSLYHSITLETTLSGLIDKINSASSTLNIVFNKQKISQATPLNYHQAFEKILDFLTRQQLVAQIIGIGHRVVHGGHYFDRAVTISDAIIAKIKALIPLAPLHNPANLEGIEFCQRYFTKTPQIALFDTAFHQTMPPQVYRYAVPQALYDERHVRKYGFHGISHQYIAQTAANYLGLNNGNFICAHLGNGCSITAIKSGLSINTSMGFTPLDGLVMGTRSGTIDPGVFSYLTKQLEVDADYIDQVLNRQSGLLGLCGLNDMRDIEYAIEQQDAKAILALDIFSHRVASYISSYMMYFEHFDGLIFTAGIGENSILVRQKIIEQLKPLGFIIDHQRNNNAKEHIEIHQNNSKRIMVLPTNEELMIAQNCQALLINGDKR